MKKTTKTMLFIVASALFLLGAFAAASPNFAKVSSASSTGSSNSPLVTLTETEYCFTGSSVNGSYYCSNSNSVMSGFTVYNETTITTTVVVPPNLGGPPRMPFGFPSRPSLASRFSSGTFYWTAAFIGLLSLLLIFFSLSRYSPIRLRVDHLFHTIHTRKKIAEKETFPTG